MCQIVHVTIHFYDRYSELNFVSFYTICSFLLVDGNRDRVKAEYQILWSLFSIAFRLLGSRRTLEFSKVMFFSVWTVILFIGKNVIHPFSTNAFPAVTLVRLTEPVPAECGQRKGTTWTSCQFHAGPTQTQQSTLHPWTMYCRQLPWGSCLRTPGGS